MVLVKTLKKRKIKGFYYCSLSKNITRYTLVVYTLWLSFTLKQWEHTISNSLMKPRHLQDSQMGTV